MATPGIATEFIIGWPFITGTLAVIIAAIIVRRL